ncbi:hypothetical protein HNQ91_002009 [Filimonas zeae]|uniref:Big-1 domain-containing protein n=1 Tax=Filimonas zeae TaxID=1737353 RepID=A0A917IYS1_9BACT|nr:hypothetical protein [Filimonas zeae]MDR6338958.1 hypothetical protein [Filimonas zeae]GGH65776.1 hypothetical protein GCM10011379_19280 [Filimonas zeae]
MKLILQLLSGCLLITGCKKDDEIYTTGNSGGTAINSILSISGITNTTVEADNSSVATIYIQVNAEADATAKSIIVTVENATFRNKQTADTLTADAYGKVIAEIVGGTPGRALFSAKTKSVQVDTSIQFIAALPDVLLLTADTTVVDTLTNPTITAGLLRAPFKGTVTDPCQVLFSVSGTGSESLVLPEMGYSTENKVSVTLKNPAHVTGSFRVEAKTVAASGDTLRKYTHIQIK